MLSVGLLRNAPSASPSLLLLTVSIRFRVDLAAVLYSMLLHSLDWMVVYYIFMSDFEFPPHEV